MTKDILHLISRSIAEQIKVQKETLENDPNYSLIRARRAYHFLAVEADKHSTNMELESGKKIRKGRGKKIATENLRLAQVYFLEKYAGQMQKDLIMDTVGFIEPNLIPAFRNTNGLMTFAQGYSRIYPKDVCGEMEHFVVENNSLSNPLEKAVHSHFQITRIHPFQDGNGRLARLIQNGILMASNYPPIVIEVGDKPGYLKLLNKAQESYKQSQGKMTREQANFYNYLAMNLWESLRQAEHNLTDK